MRLSGKCWQKAGKSIVSPLQFPVPNPDTVLAFSRLRLIAPPPPAARRIGGGGRAQLGMVKDCPYFLGVQWRAARQ